MENRFDAAFMFGTATSSFQVEGAVAEDGRSASIWDEFCRIPGKIYQGHTADIACDHYRLYKSDVEILKRIGVDAYRFSISWPRIFPAKGRYNPKGAEFYKKLVYELNKHGIAPVATLYHWDLPQWADSLGGWLNREAVHWFNEYAARMFEELGSGVKLWITHNEPFCQSMLGYYYGVHAPGRKNLRAALIAAHHLLLSHGKAVETFRRLNHAGGQIGPALNLTPCYPYANTQEAREAAFTADGLHNRWFLDPLYRAAYPEDMQAVFKSLAGELDFIQKGDMDTISTRCDFLGVNYYTRFLIAPDREGELGFRHADGSLEKTSTGREICPGALYDLVMRLKEEYIPRTPVYITENGADFDDEVTDDGRVRDPQRIDFINRHLRAVARLNAAGADIRGYFVWSLLDNFEWTYGFSKRYGIVYVDYATRQRILKDSALWYSEVIKKRRVL